MSSFDLAALEGKRSTNKHEVEMVLVRTFSCDFVDRSCRSGTEHETKLATLLREENLCVPLRNPLRPLRLILPVLPLKPPLSAHVQRLAHRGVSAHAPDF